MNNIFKLQLPKVGGGIEEVETRQSLLLIGANGAGKTRLGAWIESESPQNEKVHRISAQKSLSMPDNTTPKSIDMAKNELLYGHANAKDGQTWAYKKGNRWGQKPSTFLLNDYERLMTYLFSDHTEESAKYLRDSKATSDKIEPPITKLDLVKQVWEKILPHRELILGGLRIQTCVKGEKDKAYNASEMSDGERVIFYLIGQCLAAQKDGIIIIDEPELHLHKSVQAPLWREIERLRPDCLFVYMTHDVDFAASLHESKKIWLKSFDGSNWSWEIVNEIEGLPESLLIEVLGSRKPVVFVEGDNSSFDTSLYRAILSDYLVIPSGSCSQVIQLVKALKTSEQLHHLDVYGIIDRDRRVDSEIISLQENGIYTLEVAEVENLFCVPEIIKVVSSRLARDPEADFQSSSKFVLNNIKSELENQVSLRVVSEIKFRLNCFDEKSKGKEALRGALSSLIDSINIDALYSEFESIFNQAVSEDDYLLALRIYNRKSLAKQLSKHLGLAHGELAELVVRLANSESKSEIKNALKRYFGAFEEKIA